MVFAEISNEMNLPVGYALLMNIVGLLLIFTGAVVYRKMLRETVRSGGHVRGDLLGLPDTLVAGTLATLFITLIVSQWVMPVAASSGHAPPGSPQSANGLKIIYEALAFALPIGAIIVLLIVRGVSIVTLFGLKRVGLVRAICTAAVLLLLLLPLLFVIMYVTGQLLGGHAEQQTLVKTYREAAKAGRSEIIWQVIVTAVVIAPICEEILFRGYFYPTLKRVVGPVPAALGISLLFALVHNSAVGFPVLTVLALGFTLAYEWSGSIFIPIFMHAWFNAANLALMWWQTQQGATP